MSKEDISAWIVEQRKKRRAAQQRLYRLRKKVEEGSQAKLNMTLTEVIVNDPPIVTSAESKATFCQDSLMDINIEDLRLDIEYSVVVETFAKYGCDADAAMVHLLNLDANDDDASTSERDNDENGTQGPSVIEADTFCIDPGLGVEWVEAAVADTFSLEADEVLSARGINK